MRTGGPQGMQAWPSAASGEAMTESPPALRRKEPCESPEIGRGFWLFLGTLLAAGAFVLGIPLPNAYRAVWLGKLLDLGHVPLFFVLTWALLRALGNRPYAILGLGVLVAVLGELLQLLTDRSASVTDAARGVVGVIVALLLLRRRSLLSVRERLWKYALAASLLVWPVWDCVPALLDAVAACRSFPVLTDFRSQFEAQRWVTRSARLARVKDATRDGWRGRLDVAFGPGVAGEAIQFPVIADWRGYRWLICEFSFQGPPLTILFSIRDGRPVAAPQRRYDLQQLYLPGTHRLVVDLDRLSRGDDHCAPVDVSRVQSLHFCVINTERPRTVFLHRLVLAGATTDFADWRNAENLSSRPFRNVASDEPFIPARSPRTRRSAGQDATALSQSVQAGQSEGEELQGRHLARDPWGHLVCTRS